MGKRGFSITGPVRVAIGLIAEDWPVSLAAKECGVSQSGLFVHLSRYPGATPAERASRMLLDLPCPEAL